MLSRTVSALTALLSLVAAAPASAASPNQPDEPLAPSPPANVADSLAGHVIAGAGLSFSAPRGRFAKSALARDYVNEGMQVDGDLSLGVSRYAALGVAGKWHRYPSADSCKDCRAQGFGVGPQVRYHLVQGTRFDPWLSAAVTYQWLQLSHADQTSDFAGIDVLALRVGGDWYFASNLGIGPFLALDATVFTKRPEWAGRSDLLWSFSAGARFVFDHPGKLAQPVTTAAASR